MTSQLNQLAKNFLAGDKHSTVKALRQILKQPTELDWRWLIHALKEAETKWFVAAVFRGYPVPKRLFKPHLDAAIKETNPSTNRQLIQPCIDSFGHRRVNE